MEISAYDPVTSWWIQNKYLYFFLVFIGSLGLRTIACLLKSIHLEGFSKKVWKEFIIQFKGQRNIKEDHSEGGEGHIRKGDYWFPMIIGLIELSCFPILMITKNWTIIGAWLAFKVLPHWKVWSEDRSTFNRFLIGQGLQLIYAAIVLTQFVKLIVVK